MKGKKDNRKHKRLGAYHLVKYKPALELKRRPVLAYINNISASGVCLTTKEGLPVNSLLQIYINFPWLASSVPVLAKVIWVKKSGRKVKFESGLEFVEIDDIIQKDIYERIENVR